MFEDAVREAESLDADFAITGKLKGSLHGLPVSFKDQRATSFKVLTCVEINITRRYQGIRYHHWVYWMGSQTCCKRRRRMFIILDI